MGEPVPSSGGSDATTESVAQQIGQEKQFRAHLQR